MDIDLNQPNTRKRVAALLELLDGLNEENLISATDVAAFLRDPGPITGDNDPRLTIEIQSKTYGDDE